MKKRTLIIALLLLMLAVVSCSPQPSPGPVNEVEETADVEDVPEETEAPPEPTEIPPTATAEPTATATAEPTATPRTVLMSDDFSDVNSGWERYQEFDGFLDYVEEEAVYRMLVLPDDSLWWVSRDETLPSVVMEVDAWQVDGPEGSFFGLMCRYDPGAYDGIVFAISSDGKAGIGTLSANGPLPEADWTSFDVIKTGLNARNTIGAHCLPDKLMLVVNGEVLFEIPAFGLPGDDIGLVVGTQVDAGGADVYFDDLVIYEP
jgi:hypothetical protein